jgi:UDP-GlcNAc:undecaprenyl-phosphate GlcNAc-1-phosphate transferase
VLYGIAAATTALLLAALLAALLRLPALRFGVLDRRRQRPTPLLGGVAVALVTCLVAAAGEWTRFAPLGSEIMRLVIAAGAVAALGLVADVRRVKARFLIGGTAVAAACVVPYGDTGILLGLVAVGWIVLVAIGFKALDHADALAGTVGVLTAFGVGICAAAEVMDELAVLLSVLAAALTGFLMHNWHPARIGLGACGSLFVGFVLAASAVMTRVGWPDGRCCGAGPTISPIVCAGSASPRRVGPSCWGSRASPGYSSASSCTWDGWRRPRRSGWGWVPSSPSSRCCTSSRTGLGVNPIFP